MDISVDPVKTEVTKEQVSSFPASKCPGREWHPERCQSLSEVKLGEIPDNRVLASTAVVKYDLHTHQCVAELFNMYHTNIFIFIGFIQKAPISLMCFIARASLPSLCGYTLLCISLILLKLNPVHAT